MLTYTELQELETYEDRLEYLRTNGLSSELTFDKLRVLNQRFYNSPEWKRVRRFVIARDLGYDLGVPGREINGRVMVHHMNPLLPKDLLVNVELALDPEFLITVSHDTHQAIHFGVEPLEPMSDRRPGDTKLW